MGTEQSTERTVVYLGNRNAAEAVRDPDSGVLTMQAMPAGKRCTEIKVEPGLTLMEAASVITHSRGVWTSHSVPGASPAWVASTDPALASLLASHYKCELREPEPDHVPSGMPDTGLEG